MKSRRKDTGSKESIKHNLREDNMRTFLADLNQMVMVVIMIMTIMMVMMVMLNMCTFQNVIRQISIVAEHHFRVCARRKYFQALKVLQLPLIRDLMVTEPFQMISNLVKSYE